MFSHLDQKVITYLVNFLNYCYTTSLIDKYDLFQKICEALRTENGLLDSFLLNLIIQYYRDIVLIPNLAYKILDYCRFLLASSRVCEPPASAFPPSLPPGEDLFSFRSQCAFFHCGTDANFVVLATFWSKTRNSNLLCYLYHQ